ncbi:MAG: DUF389 domain-containing protein, partial [Sinomicrobium sp.]|nr:DUF389 domain-containing protein [Sinomicrobium sp.]
TDRETTIQHIKDDISFKGHTSWILVCSIFIASVGLNANATAVVIGAMLISPLMGPILGMGMAVATNDIDTLRRSLKNFGVMVGLSIVTAFLFFELFPLRDESSELLARTAPDIRDVLIAFFGGLALVIARAKRGTIASVIYGVAIATALMPPLCTVGFGLAIGNFRYAGGALYLFIINTIFIGLATFLVLKLLRFPMVRYANSVKRKRIARIASLLALLVMIPAGYTFFNVWQKSRFMDQAQLFINETIGTYQFGGSGRFLDNLTTIDYNDGDNPRIELVCMGDAVIPENVIETWKVRKDSYTMLKNASLQVVQGGRDDSEEKFRYVSELYETKKAELVSKDKRIRVLEEELANLSSQVSKQIPFAALSQEARINYENLSGLGFSYTVTTDFIRTDTVPVFSAKWKPGTTAEERAKSMKRLTAWLKFKLKDSTLSVISPE